MADTEADVIRLSVPADPNLRTVAEVAVAVLASRLRLTSDAIAAARTAAGTAFDDMARRAGDGPVEVEVHVLDARLVVHLRADGATRSLTIPDEPPSPPA